MSGTIKPQKAWAVTAIDGRHVLDWTIRRTRVEAIKASLLPDEMPDGDWRQAWNEWRSRGCRVVKATITVDPQA